MLILLFLSVSVSYLFYVCCSAANWPTDQIKVVLRVGPKLEALGAFQCDVLVQRHQIKKKHFQSGQMFFSIGSVSADTEPRVSVPEVETGLVHP